MDGKLLGALFIAFAPGIFLAIAGGLSAVILVASYVVAPQRPDPEKVSAYECGFDAFGDARQKFSQHNSLLFGTSYAIIQPGGPLPCLPRNSRSRSRWQSRTKAVTTPPTRPRFGTSTPTRPCSSR